MMACQISMYDNVATNKFALVNRNAAAPARLEELSEIIMSFRMRWFHAVARGCLANLPPRTI